MAVLLRVAVAAMALVLFPVSVSAQDTAIAFGTLAHDSGLPVEITAEALDVDQEDGTATFRGGVLVGQGEMRLSADRVLVVYGETPEGARARIARLEASGNVLMTLGAEAAEAQNAVYTIDRAKVVMTGDVLLTQGDSAIAGQRLEVDLGRGTGAMSGRVRTVFQPEGRAD
ncbi:lipopolysaccharide export system protein LptA [Rhodovulum bhavnagarense]|uniref:Lipopolysaccharide export system protein LptA n=1 Tax=Rhodovulum bhavnagarense TaxID=992286 RepID=A0A4R2R9H2_9RHOB|nr:LptA/OstA family protein [Rhodovulum bhavnagarense]TCP58718.1 lipopolysaccharide export system protein LptA [Rhodovulum bhavnagarense]